QPTLVKSVHLLPRRAVSLLKTSYELGLRQSRRGRHRPSIIGRCGRRGSRPHLPLPNAHAASEFSLRGDRRLLSRRASKTSQPTGRRTRMTPPEETAPSAIMKRAPTRRGRKGGSTSGGTAVRLRRPDPP